MLVVSTLRHLYQFIVTKKNMTGTCFNNFLVIVAHIIVLHAVSTMEVMGPEYGTRQFAPNDRHKAPLCEHLRHYLRNGTVFVEITSGTGQLIAYLAKNFPEIKFIPTEHDSSLMRPILDHVEAHYGHNLLKPFYVDVRTDPQRWFDFTIRQGTVDYIFNSHLVHVAPPECYKALFRSTAKYLKRRGLLFMFGPFKYFNQTYPPTNKEFDETLRKANPLWGLRDVVLELSKEAEKNDLYWVVTHNFPFPSQLLVFKKGSRLMY